MPAERSHEYRVTNRWTGNRGEGTSGCRAYSRGHELTGVGKTAPIADSSDAMFRVGARQHVAIEVDQGDSSHPMSWWSAAAGGWQTALGDYTVWVGNSSAAADLAVARTLHVGS